MALVKVALAVLLVSGLFYYNVITVAALKATFGNVRSAAGACAALALAYFLSALRWYFILHALGIPIRLRPCAEIFAMGTFANNLMLGGTGGDVVRAVYVSMHLHRDRAGGVISVLLDRAAGLLGMLTLGVVFGILDVGHVVGSPVTRTVFLWLCGGFAAGMAGIVVVFVVMNREFHAWMTDRLGTRTVIHRVVLRLFETVVQLRRDPVARHRRFHAVARYNLAGRRCDRVLRFGLRSRGTWLDRLRQRYHHCAAGKCHPDHARRNWGGGGGVRVAVQDVAAASDGTALRQHLFRTKADHDRDQPDRLHCICHLPGRTEPKCRRVKRLLRRSSPDHRHARNALPGPKLSYLLKT